MTTTAEQNRPFVRDSFTWLAYIMLGFFAFLQGVPGVAMPLLRDDLNLSYTVGGMHVSAMALGSVLVGLFNDRVVKRVGRRNIFWIGSAGMASGGLILIAGRHPAVTILGVFVMGLFGTSMLVTIQAALSDHHGAQRAFALTESNVMAAAALIIPPLLIGGCERVGLGWRTALLLPVLVWLILFATLRTTPITPPAAAPTAEAAATRGRLPRLFWFYWVVLALSVAVEWSLFAWSADFMVEIGNLRKADGSLMMSFFSLAMLIGRYTGSRLTRRYNLERLLFLVMGVGLTGFVLLWWGTLLPVMVAGLFVAGLGIANMFPFLLSIAMSTAPDHADLASTRISVAAGSAILIAPQVLGMTADQTDIQIAFGLVFGLYVLAIATTVAARRLSAQTAAG